MKWYIKIKASHECYWVSGMEGDPPRTRLFENATSFDSEISAVRKMNALAKLFPSRGFSVIKK